MPRSAHKSKPHNKAANEATLAHALAPEEIRPGDHVALLYEIFEYPSWFWCDNSLLASRQETVPIRTIPHSDAFPMKVLAVCLPYVFIRQPCGAERTLDIRRCRLARLHENYASAAWQSYRNAAKKRRKEQKGEAAKK